MSVREIGNISSYKKGILHWQNKAASLERAHDELEEEVIECEAQLDEAKQRVAELEEALEVIRDLARTGLAPDILHYKVNRVAGIANVALNKGQEV